MPKQTEKVSPTRNRSRCGKNESALSFLLFSYRRTASLRALRNERQQDCRKICVIKFADEQLPIVVQWMIWEDCQRGGRKAPSGESAMAYRLLTYGPPTFDP